MRSTRRGGTAVSHAIDMSRIAMGLRRPGIDPRMWVSYGTVSTGEITQGADDSGEWKPLQYDVENPHAIAIAPSGIMVDVVLEPSGVPATCQYAGIAGGEGVCIMAPIKPGDRVLVEMPGGDNSGPPVIVAILNSEAVRMPVGEDGKPLFQNDRVLVYAKDVPLDLRTAGGARVQVQTDGQVILNEGEKGIARKTDSTKLTLSRDDIRRLAVVLLETTGFSPGSTPIPPPDDITFEGGEITSASETAKAG